MPVGKGQADGRRGRWYGWIKCNVCNQRVLLLDGGERSERVIESGVAEMVRAEDKRRDQEASSSVLQGKMETNDFDVFLCHNGHDKPAIREIAYRLKQEGIYAWLDEEQLRPGLPWQMALDQQIRSVGVAAVFVGDNGIGPWRGREFDACLRNSVRSDKPVIPVILPDCKSAPQLPVFLESMMWVYFTIEESDPLKQLIWGVTV